LKELKCKDTKPLEKKKKRRFLECLSSKRRRSNSSLEYKLSQSLCHLMIHQIIYRHYLWIKISL